jgi:hypothetical protein
MGKLSCTAKSLIVIPANAGIHTPWRTLRGTLLEDFHATACGYGSQLGGRDDDVEKFAFQTAETTEIVIPAKAGIQYAAASRFYR